MSDTTCTVREVVYENGTKKAKVINRHYGADETSMDSAMCSALVNNDKNHFYFCHPDLVSHRSKHRFACAWCNTLCDAEYCGDICAINADLNFALSEAEKDHKDIVRPDTLRYPALTDLNIDL